MLILLRVECEAVKEGQQTTQQQQNQNRQLNGIWRYFYTNIAHAQCYLTQLLETSAYLPTNYPKSNQ